MGNRRTTSKGFSSLVFTVAAVPLLLLQLRTTSGDPQCHESIGQKALQHLSTKGPYNNNWNADSSHHTPEGCSPVKLWYFGRHGTRYPGADDIIAMQSVIPRLHAEILSSRNFSELCPDTLQYFSQWQPRPDLNISTDGYLHSQGAYELSAISSRYMARYPSIYEPDFSNSSYYFRFTASQRTEASAHAFASSIFGREKIDRVYFPPPLSNDPILRFYTSCPKWQEEVDKNPAARIELDLFVNSTTMAKTISNVSRRVGLQRNLTIDEITIIYTTCGYETAWNNSTLSEWCVLFDLEDFRVMAYREDLEYYWTDGYGYKINYEQACSPFKDAVNFFNEYPGENSTEEYRKVQAYFSHSGATLKMFARLGLFNGNRGEGGGPMEIRHDNYEEIKEIYQWKTSQIDFMGTNMAFVMFTCSNSTGADSKQIGLFTQETPTEFAACKGKAICPYSEFVDEMSKFTNDCDLERICRV